jgi:hypothetical protein
MCHSSAGASPPRLQILWNTATSMMLSIINRLLHPSPSFYRCTVIDIMLSLITVIDTLTFLKRPIPFYSSSFSCLANCSTAPPSHLSPTALQLLLLISRQLLYSSSFSSLAICSAIICATTSGGGSVLGASSPRFSLPGPPCVYSNFPLS